MPRQRLQQAYLRNQGTERHQVSQIGRESTLCPRQGLQLGTTEGTEHHHSPEHPD